MNKFAKANILKILLLISHLNLSGCAIIDHHLESGAMLIESIAKSREYYQDCFLGRSKNYVIQELGSADIIKTKAPRSGLVYKEEWIYKKIKSIGLDNKSHMLGLYFNEDYVEHISVW